MRSKPKNVSATHENMGQRLVAAVQVKKFKVCLSLVSSPWFSSSPGRLLAVGGQCRVGILSQVGLPQVPQWPLLKNTAEAVLPSQPSIYLPEDLEGFAAHPKPG